MNNNTWILLKAQLLNQSGVNTFKYEKDKKKKNKVVIFAFVMTITVLMLGVYCFAMAYGLGSIGLTSIIPGYAFTITSLLIMFFTLFKASGTLFAFKDYDMLMSLPVQTSSVITSRFLLMYGMNVIFSLVIMLPMGAAYCLLSRPQMIFYVMWLIAIFITPLVPMTIAAILGAFISAISSKFKHTNMINIILSFVITIAFMGAGISAGAMGSSSQIDIQKLASLGTMLSSKMNQMYPLSSLFVKAVCQYNVGAFLAFIVISVVWYYVFVKIVSIKYTSINTALTSHQTKSNYKLQGLKQSSPFMALHRKEMKRFFSSYLYVLNVGMGAALLLVASITSFILGLDKLQQLTGITDTKTIINFMPFVISTTLAMTCTSAVSLSLEGKNLWILQSAPIDVATIYRSKMAVNITLLLPVSLLSSLLLSLCLKTDIMATTWMFITPLAYSFLTSVWGIFINLKIPNFTWESEVTVIKQSMASVVGMLGGMLFGFISIVILLLLPGININLLTGMITFVVIGFTSLLYINVCNTKLPS